MTDEPHDYHPNNELIAMLDDLDDQAKFVCQSCGHDKRARAEVGVEPLVWEPRSYFVGMSQDVTDGMVAYPNGSLESYNAIPTGWWGGLTVFEHQDGLSASMAAANTHNETRIRSQLTAAPTPSALEVERDRLRDALEISGNMLERIDRAYRHNMPGFASDIGANAFDIALQRTRAALSDTQSEPAEGE